MIQHLLYYFPDENLSSADPSVQEKSIAAVPSFVAEFYSDAAEAKVDQVSSPLLLKRSKLPKH
jgi:hypothetical protein